MVARTDLPLTDAEPEAGLDRREWDTIAHYLKGNQEAIAMCRVINRVINIWDDLVDDGRQPDAVVHEAFIGALVELPRNAFYRQWQHELQPLIEAGIWNWLAANEFERGTREERARAHVLRFAGMDVFIMAARILGGFEWATKAAEELRALMPEESLEEYMGELHGRQVTET